MTATTDTTTRHTCLVRMHRPDSSGGDRTVRVRVSEAEIRAYGADPEVALEALARAHAVRQVYGARAGWRPEAQYPHRGQVFVRAREGEASAITPVITLRVEEV